MTTMKPVNPEDRRVANIFETPFTPFVYEDGRTDGDAVLQLLVVPGSPVPAIALARAGAGVVGCLEPSVRGDLARGRLVEAFPGFGFPAVAMRIGVSRGHQTPAALLVATELARSLAGFLAPGE